MQTLNEAWLEARKGYVTASSVAGYISDSRRASLKHKMQQAWKVPTSSGSEYAMPKAAVQAAKRGHQMEAAIAPMLKGAHQWEDVIIKSDTSNIALSPDYLDIPNKYITEVNVNDLPEVKEAWEIKSYGREHYDKVIGEPNKMKIKEVWQLATYMYMLPTLETIHLIMVDPDCDDELPRYKKITYKRSDLEKLFQRINKLDIMTGVVIAADDGSDKYADVKECYHDLDDNAVHMITHLQKLKDNDYSERHFAHICFRSMYTLWKAQLQSGTLDDFLSWCERFLIGMKGDVR